MSEKDGLNLSRRQALAGIGGIGVASVGAGFGTSAYFSDGVTFEDNTLAAGELDLRIDWQQLYWGPEENTDHYAPYGTSGRPFVNAHPDHNTDGMQSLDLAEVDEGEFADDDYVVTYMDEVEDPEDGANIQEYLDCDTLRNFEVPDDFDNGVRTQDSLIELEDVKPGDEGEVTFSLHLCDNPGYVWMLSQKTEYDEELAKAITATVWYDIECTNVFDEDDGDRVLVASTTLYNLLNNELSPDGRVLSPEPYGLGLTPGSETPTDGEFECLHAGKIEFEENGLTIEDGTWEVYDTDPLVLRVTFDIEDDEDMTVELSQLKVKTNAFETTLANNVDDYDLSEVVEYDWAVVDDAPDRGMCKKRMKSGTTEREFDLVTALGCTTSQTNVRTVGTGPQGQPQGISNIEFDYCADDEPPGLCFPTSNTFCVAMKWELPTTTPDHVDDINDLQGQSVGFDLGFYTEQCRHNADPDGPSGFS